MTDKISIPRPEPIFWLSDARGIYIPRDFANSFSNRHRIVSGVEADNWAVLDAGPEHELYWDTWSDVCDNAIVTNKNGIKYRLHQDGDLWLIPEGMVWDDNKDFWAWPEDLEPDEGEED
jgi:hypothetical protein